MNDCGIILRKWRKKRRYSQLNLSLESGISSRHLSFIETGRSLPSKEMILRIQQFLEIPRIDLNQVLRSAGHLPQYQELSSKNEDLRMIYQAIDRIMEQQMPYPAFVLDRHWNVINANSSMQKLLIDIGIVKHNNIIEALTDIEFNREFIENYYEVIELLNHRLKSEISYNGSDKILINLEKKLSAINKYNVNNTRDIVLNTRFDIHGIKLKLFSTITELGAVQEINVGCFKIEQMFPIDEETKEYFIRKINNN